MGTAVVWYLLIGFVLMLVCTAIIIQEQRTLAEESALNLEDANDRTILYVSIVVFSLAVLFAWPRLLWSVATMTYRSSRTA